MRKLILLALAGALAAQSPTWRIESAGSITPTDPTAAHRLRDLDGDGRTELVLVSTTGQVRVWQLATGTAEPTALGEPLQLDDPDYSLLALADVAGDKHLELVLLGRRGTVAWTYDAEEGYRGRPTPLARTGKLSIRTGQPAFSNFVRDVNADGRGDLIVPLGATCELWLQTGREGDQATFERIQELPLAIERSRQYRAGLASSRLRNQVEVPSLAIEDVNGDDRPDLKVVKGKQRAFYLQGKDGRFAEQPIRVDLSMFRDTTPKTEIELGQTAVLGDRATMQSGDLNADGIPDHVIAHRRKLWTFLATEDGPQFRRSRTRMVAEDITALLLVHLDEDDRKDLLIFKVVLPGAAELLLGLVQSIDIEIRALGYRTGEDGAFGTKAEWRRSLTLRVPSILRLMAEADDLVERFTEVLGKLRWSARDDFDGDGADDLALVTEDEGAVELWRKSNEETDTDRIRERWFRQLLFENANTVFDVERIFQLAAQVFDVRTANLTGKRPADARVDLPDRAGRIFVQWSAADLDGDGRAELILVDAPEKDPASQRFSILRWVRR